MLQQRGGLRAPPLSLRHPSCFARLGGQVTWLVGFGLLIPGWILQAMALDRGRVGPSGRCPRPASSCSD